MTTLTNGRNGATAEWLREMIKMETNPEPEDDSEISDATHPLQTVQSWPATAESAFTEMDALCSTQEIGLPGVPYAERPECADQSAAVAFLMVRQAV